MNIRPLRSVAAASPAVPLGRCAGAAAGGGASPPVGLAGLREQPLEPRSPLAQILWRIVRDAPLCALGLALASCSGVAGTAPVQSAVQAPPVSGAPAYVAQTCDRKGEACPFPNGVIQILGGSPITSGIENPSAIAFDSSGTAYVANSSASKAYVTIYSAGSVKPRRTISGIQGTPRALAIGRSGELYVVSNYRYQCCQIKGAIAVYGARGAAPLRTLTDVSSFPGQPAFDPRGNVYIPNFYDFPGYVDVYAPNADSPSRTIREGIGFPQAVAFDRVGRLYVLNGVFGGGYDVTVYAPGTGKVIRTISDGLVESSGMAFDASGDLFVSNRGTLKIPSTVTVYAPGSTAVSRTIATGIRDPIALAFDPSGNLYVVNAPYFGADNVTVYAPGASAPSRIYKLQESASALAIPPG